MDYFKQVEILANTVLNNSNEYFNRHIRSALEDYDGSFILGIYPDNAELLILDTDSNGFTLGEKEAEMEYMHRMLFEKDVPLYIHGQDDEVEEIDRERAFDIYVAFCAKLFSNPQVANLEYQ